MIFTKNVSCLRIVSAINLVHLPPPVLTLKESYCSTVHSPAWESNKTQQDKTASVLPHKIIFYHRLSARTDIELFITQKQPAEGAGLSKSTIFQLGCQTRAFKRTIRINHPFVPLPQCWRLVKTLFGALARKSTTSKALLSWERRAQRRQ